MQWVLEMRDLQLAVSSEMIKNKAKVVITPHLSTFKAFNGRLEKFLRLLIVCDFCKYNCRSSLFSFCWRHSLVFRQKTSMAQKLPKNLEEHVEKYSNSIKELREKTDVPKW